VTDTVEVLKGGTGMALGKPDMKILVVDDFPTMRRIVKTILKQLGYENTVEAEDGALGLAALEKDKTIEFVMSDWNMPNMSGIELLKNVRKHPKLKNIPFVLVTAEAEKENIIEAVKAGVNNYVVKPFTAEQLKEKLDKVFANLAKKSA
jgi:two-component system, chemotaxis family, chemotaxis protein CheY